MAYLVLSFIFFTTSIIIHVWWCRRKPQGLQAKIFLIIAGGGFLLCGGLFFYLVFTTRMDASSLWGMPIYVSSLVIHGLLVPAYLIFYVSTQLISPSKKILQIVSRSGGAAYQQILEQLEGERFVQSRLQELLQSGCVQCRDGYFILTAHGRRIAWALDLYQNFLGRATGG